jgi:hypothetical protein
MSLIKARSIRLDRHVEHMEEIRNVIGRVKGKCLLGVQSVEGRII